MLAVIPAQARADEIYVKGGVIEGRLLDETRDGVKIETPSGQLLVPRSAITRRVEGASRLELYALERGKYQGMLQADQHVELVRWCRQQRLSTLAEQHLEAALSLDPQAPETLELAGYVRLGDLWLYTGPPVLAQAQRRQADQVDKIITALKNGWYRRIRGLEESYLSGKDPSRSFSAGRHQLLALGEPLVIPAACRAFGDADVPLRVVLAQMLSGFEQDEAGLNLLLLVLFDPSVEVREAATLELTRREDDRPARLLRLSLRCSAETLLLRAAVALGIMRERDAVADLIAALTVEGAVGAPVTPQQLLDDILAAHPTPLRVPLDDLPVELPPQPRIPGFKSMFQEMVDEVGTPSGRLRSEVQDALILITGENFGFDLEAWEEWHAAQESAEP